MEAGCAEPEFSLVGCVDARQSLTCKQLLRTAQPAYSLNAACPVPLATTSPHDTNHMLCHCSLLLTGTAPTTALLPAGSTTASVTRAASSTHLLP